MIELGQGRLTAILPEFYHIDIVVSASKWQEKERLEKLKGKDDIGST